MRHIAAAIVLVFVAAGASNAQDAAKKPTAKPRVSAQAKIRDALSAAPADIAKGAMVMDWPDKEGAPMKMLRAGTNGWTCMPSNPDLKSAALHDPMCFDKTWQAWADAYMSKKDPQVKTTGVAYMLHGDAGASNTDPFAAKPTANNQWVVSPAHVMILLPDPAGLDAFPTDPHNGGPWVMWKGTKYAHLMVPMGAMPKQAGALKTAKTP
jgi:hypothetical protein